MQSLSSFSNDVGDGDGDGSENGYVKKAIGFLSKNNNFPRAARFFVHFRCSLHHYDVKLPKCTFYGGRKQLTTNFSFSPRQT